jgi:hypothetical protein
MLLQADGISVGIRQASCGEMRQRFCVVSREYSGIGRRHVVGAEARCESFKLLARLIDFADVLDGCLGNYHAAWRKDPDQASRGQFPQRLAHRRPAGPQLLGELVLREKAAGRVTQVRVAEGDLGLNTSAATTRRRAGCGSRPQAR